MKRPLAGLFCALLLAAAHAGDTPTDAPTDAPRTAPGMVPDIAPAEAARPALQVPPGRLGYAFERPEILIRQRLFGLAHGLSLLAAACLDLPEHSAAIQDAYAAWHAGQARSIEVLALDLSRYYFADRAAEATWPDVARALGLHESIHPSLGRIALADACASLPAAIGQPRYRFDRLLAEADDAQAAPAPAAVPPAPTPGEAAQ